MRTTASKRKLVYNSRFVTNLITVFFCAFYVSNSFAIDPSSTLPIEIESDTATLNETEGTSRYEGNVIVRQGETLLTADVILVRAIEREITSIEATGQPAKFEQKESPEQQTAGSAKTITYIAKDALLRFDGNAELRQQNNSFSGESITYDIANRAIKAKGDEQKGERVKIEYHPTPKDPEQTAPNEAKGSISNSLDATIQPASDPIE